MESIHHEEMNHQLTDKRAHITDELTIQTDESTSPHVSSPLSSRGLLEEPHSEDSSGLAAKAVPLDEPRDISAMKVSDELPSVSTVPESSGCQTSRQQVTSTAFLFSRFELLYLLSS
jgi:hypothetical protein